MLTNVDTLEFPTNAAEHDGADASPTSKRSKKRSRQRPFLQRAYMPVRRVLDFSLALVLTLIALPVVLLAALAMKLTSRGPAFYTQVRTGKNGKPFTIYKIRSMIDKCESLTGPRWTIPGDPRITPVGWFLRRSHIDELPQLLNVLKGEMSLIGPRPERPEFVSDLEQVIDDYQARHDVLPGITGLAQVQLAPDSDIDSVRRKLRYDLHYIAHCGMLLDLRILMATGLHMLGMSYPLLAKLCIVPGPRQVEQPVSLPFPNRQSSTRKQAA
jgi:lipopolysaccharide/colanic/teichoic acid biosynthesis glycosyltransferase